MTSQFLVWNAQGVANARTKRHLRYLIWEHKILFAAVIEPQRTPPALGMNFQGLRFVGSNESGHIWILAHDDWTVEVVDNSRQALHVKVSAAVLPFPICITIVYGRHTRETRQELWEKLGDISLTMEGRLWIVGEDFNMFLTNEEMQGSDTDRHRDMMDFANAIAEYQLIDPGFDGPIFTWHRGGLWERLDRILIGEHWISVFATTRVTHLTRFSSNHAPLLVRCQFSVQTTRPAFRFQNMTKKFLKVWNREVFGNIIQNLKDAEQAVLEAQILYDTDPTPAHKAEFSRVSVEFIITAKMEEEFWRQKVAIRWASDGERNSKFFHGWVRQKIVKSRIHTVDFEGHALTIETEMRESAAAFFQQLLTSNVGELAEPDLSLIHTLPDSVDQEALCSAPQDKEVRDAVFGISGDSVSGPDGLLLETSSVGLLSPEVSRRP
ncbi:uncharacterized protein LOC121800853 [Salvia splendens]|uniref:uncharacterized protein LOC121800853 n=1 Tax=Salvia splendens TaxID=180675 RepID=UPI001C27383B|nr:uncharacterized protein LOC121800853 [Salvia splendens]